MYHEYDNKEIIIIIIWLPGLRAKADGSLLRPRTPSWSFRCLRATAASTAACPPPIPKSPLRPRSVYKTTYYWRSTKSSLTCGPTIFSPSKLSDTFYLAISPVKMCSECASRVTWSRARSPTTTNSDRWCVAAVFSMSTRIRLSIFFLIFLVAAVSNHPPPDVASKNNSVPVRPISEGAAPCPYWHAPCPN